MDPVVVVDIHDDPMLQVTHTHHTHTTHTALNKERTFKNNFPKCPQADLVSQALKSIESKQKEVLLTYWLAEEGSCANECALSHKRSVRPRARKGKHFHTDGGFCVWLGGRARELVRARGGDFLGFVQRSMLGVSKVERGVDEMLLDAFLTLCRLDDDSDGPGSSLRDLTIYQEHQHQIVGVAPCMSRLQHEESVFDVEHVTLCVGSLRHQGPPTALYVCAEALGK